MTHTTTEERLTEFMKENSVYTPGSPFGIKLLAHIEDEKRIVREETLDIISEGEGWEQTRDKYAAQLGLKWVYTDRFHSQEDTNKQDNNN